MKKSLKVVAIAVLLFSGYMAQAQIFGIKGGVGLANITSPNEFDNRLYGRALGARIGGTIEFEIIDNLYIGSGLGFAKKGGSTSTNNLNFYYVETPVGARYNIFEIGRSAHFYATSGLNIGVLVSADNGTRNLEIGTMAGDEIKALDLGLNMGTGVIFDDRFEVGLISEFGLIDISATDSSNLKNITLMVSFGFKFGQ